jgi:hypothetical protein
MGDVVAQLLLPVLEDAPQLLADDVGEVLEERQSREVLAGKNS